MLILFLQNHRRWSQEAAEAGFRHPDWRVGYQRKKQTHRPGFDTPVCQSGFVPSCWLFIRWPSEAWACPKTCRWAISSGAWSVFRVFPYDRDQERSSCSGSHEHPLESPHRPAGRNRNWTVRHDHTPLAVFRAGTHHWQLQSSSHHSERAETGGWSLWSRVFGPVSKKYLSRRCLYIWNIQEDGPVNPQQSGREKIKHRKGKREHERILRITDTALTFK